MMISMIMAVVRMVPSATARNIDQRHAPLPGRQNERCDHTERGGLGRRGDARIDRADDDEKDEQRRDQARQHTNAIGPVRFDRYAALAAGDGTGRENDDHEESDAR